MRWFYKLIHRIVSKAARETFIARLDALNAAGHAISTKAQWGPRVEIHAADSSLVRIPDSAEILHDCWLIAHPGDKLQLGERVFVSQHCTISGDVSIGDDTLMGGFVSIIDANHNFERTDIPINKQGGEGIGIRIGEDVWIGAGAVILAGASIGDHAVIAANSTVTGDIPAWAVAAGSPARVIKYRNEEQREDPQDNIQ
ncbi:MAG: hypothetical protein CL946_09580 [Ectothiorhodospiraceae bacterium]|nr:hypothetical protein [Ectothiorhodospiraceae bacterium]